MKFLEKLRSIAKNINENKHLFYRLILSGAAFFYLIFGILYRTNTFPANDPLTLTTRITAAALFLIIVILSYYIEKIKENIYRVTTFATFIALIHLLYISYKSNFNFTVSSSILVTVFTINLIFQKGKHFKWYNLLFSFLLISTIILDSYVIINKFVFISSYIFMNSVSYFISTLNLKNQKELEKIAAEYETIINNTTDSVVLIDIKHSKFVYSKVNAAYEKNLGIPAEKIKGKTPHDIHNKKTASFLEKQYEKCLKEKEVQVFDEKIETTSGKKYWHTKLSPVIIEDKVKQIVCISRDISEKKKANKKIKQLTFQDNLTGLYNRTFFQKEIQKYASSDMEPLGVIIGDVNGLKLANDAFGHEKGDKLLKKVADKIKNSCRGDDLIARWGGDEFVILLPWTDYKGAKKVCERIKNNIKNLKPDPVKPSIALGCSVKENSEHNINEILKEAENKMYKNKLDESKDIHGTIISSLKETFHANTCETEEHCSRVKNMAVKLAKELNIDKHLINDLKLLAEMHDIGKVGIPDEIINKRNGLTDKEWKKIKRHSEIGYQIASSTPEMSNIADAILSHHERWDGKGYPLGRSGNDIPLLARIISIVDAYDVMTNGRPYQKAISREKAVEKLTDGAGKQFDPELVKTFIENILNLPWKGDKYDTA